MGYNWKNLQGQGDVFETLWAGCMAQKTEGGYRPEPDRGDGGVDYRVGNRVWQVKSFTNIESSQWRQIKESMESLTKRYPEVTEWTLVTLKNPTQAQLNKIDKLVTEHLPNVDTWHWKGEDALNIFAAEYPDFVNMMTGQPNRITSDLAELARLTETSPINPENFAAQIMKKVELINGMNPIFTVSVAVDSSENMKVELNESDLIFSHTVTSQSGHPICTIGYFRKIPGIGYPTITRECADGILASEGNIESFSMTIPGFPPFAKEGKISVVFGPARLSEPFLLFAGSESKRLPVILTKVNPISGPGTIVFLSADEAIELTVYEPETDQVFISFTAFPQTISETFDLNLTYGVLIEGLLAGEELVMIRNDNSCSVALRCPNVIASVKPEEISNFEDILRSLKNWVIVGLSARAQGQTIRVLNIYGFDKPNKEEDLIVDEFWEKAKSFGLLTKLTR